MVHYGRIKGDPKRRSRCVERVTETLTSIFIRNIRRRPRECPWLRSVLGSVRVGFNNIAEVGVSARVFNAQMYIYVYMGV